MIYTVTFNPAIDYVMQLPEVKLGATNRSASEEVYYGGKGLNVSQVLQQLDVKSCALGFAAGFTGAAIEAGMQEQGIMTDFVFLSEGCSRINVKLKSGVETELNGSGPNIGRSALSELFYKLNDLKKGDVLVLAGSVPKSIPDDIYEQIMCALSDNGVRFVVDAEKTLLTNTLKYKPFLVKPNKKELGDLFGVELNSPSEIVECARQLREMGAVNVLVSMGGDGSVLVNEYDQVTFVGVPEGGIAVNTVGSGDSMVAGFLAGYLEAQDYSMAHLMAAACGSATAYSAGLGKKDSIMALLSDLMLGGVLKL